jgi:pilus assembly protein CpaE
MGVKNLVLLLTHDEQVADSVRQAMASKENLPPCRTCADLDELARTLERQPVSAVLVDIDPQPERALRALESVITRYEWTRFIVLCSQFRDDLVLEAMQIGARQYIVKESIRNELPGVLGRLIGAGNSKEAHRPRGSAVSVLSASGGCGSTTLAINLANELQLLQGGRVLLIDMDHSYGAVATYLGVKGSYGLADVLAHSDSVDPDLIASTVLQFSDQLHVLVSPASVDFSSPAKLQYEHLETAMQACRSVYDWVVVDAPRVSMDVAATLAEQSRMTMIVHQLSVKDIQISAAMALALAERSVDTRQLLHVANRYRKRSPMVSIEEAQQALHVPSVEQIGNDFRSAIMSINLGKPLSESAPHSSLRRDIQHLAQMALQHAAPHKTAEIMPWA